MVSTARYPIASGAESCRITESTAKAKGGGEAGAAPHKNLSPQVAGGKAAAVLVMKAAQAILSRATGGCWWWGGCGDDIEDVKKVNRHLMRRKKGNEK